MPRYAVIDCETSGLFDFSKPADAEGQPRLANLAMILLDDNLLVYRKVNVFVKPEGWSMSPEATKIHGLTDAVLKEYGFPVNDVLTEYVAAIWNGYVIAAYNAQYDTKILRGELRRAGREDLFEETPNICLMRAMTPICKIPAKTRKGYKFPKLEEACRHFGIPYPEKHTALGDALVELELLRNLAQLNALPKPEVHYARHRPETEST